MLHRRSVVTILLFLTSFGSNEQSWRFLLLASTVFFCYRCCSCNKCGKLHIAKQFSWKGFFYFPVLVIFSQARPKLAFWFYRVLRKYPQRKLMSLKVPGDKRMFFHKVTLCLECFFKEFLKGFWLESYELLLLSQLCYF